MKTINLASLRVAEVFGWHNAAMECYRRAMIDEQTFEGRQENLAQANKLSRTYATLLEALNRHRGKGQQKVVVEQSTSIPGRKRSSASSRKAVDRRSSSVSSHFTRKELRRWTSTRA
jgi:hypothetical protein